MQRCEVCANFRPHAEVGPKTKLVMMDFDVRRVVLCTGHARIAMNNGATTFEKLRELYGKGRRSHVPRRAPDEHRDAGRRASDAR